MKRKRCLSFVLSVIIMLTVVFCVPVSVGAYDATEVAKLQAFLNQTNAEGVTNAQILGCNVRPVNLERSYL